MDTGHEVNLFNLVIHLSVCWYVQVQSEDFVKIECVVEEGHHILCTLNPLTNRSLVHSIIIIYYNVFDV